MSGDGVPLGVVNLEFDAPSGASEEGRPVEERKTGRWLRGLRHSIAAAKELDGVKAVAVKDREGDVFDVLHEHRAAGCGTAWPRRVRTTDLVPGPGARECRTATASRSRQ